MSKSETTPARFPILIHGRIDGRKPSIPWAAIAPHERQANLNHGQSLRRLAERGGLCWSEAWGVMKGVSWSRLPRGREDECRREVLAMCGEPANAR
jgi:hypothetical protein